MGIILEQHHRLKMITYYQNKASKHSGLCALFCVLLGLCVIIPCVCFNGATLVGGILFGLLFFCLALWHGLMSADYTYEAERMMKYGW